MTVKWILVLLTKLLSETTITYSLSVYISRANRTHKYQQQPSYAGEEKLQEVQGVEVVSCMQCLSSFIPGQEKPIHVS